MAKDETNPVEAIRKSEKESITPEFRNSVKGSKKENAANTLGEAENSAAVSAVDDNGSKGGYSGGLYNSKKANQRGDKNSKGKMRFLKGPSIAIIGLVLLAGFIIIPSVPLIAIGAIDYNLQASLGFSATSGILEKVASFVIAEKLSKGEFPSGLGEDFADAGLMVGQVTANGEFVRTNKYLADLDNGVEVAAVGFDYEKKGDEGELAVLYGDKIIAADDFVLAVESDSKMYADYSEALDIKARFYYSDEVSDVYEDLGLDRTAFSNWTITGDNEEDEKKYYETINKILKDDSSVEIAGCDNDNCEPGGFSVDEASKVAGGTEKASQLLNMAVSSTEPQKAAKAFLAIEEPIQRARLSGEGPINQVMNSLNRQVEISYVDVNTNQEVTERKSILETRNFAAAVARNGYSKDEANNFSRDRVLIATGMSSADGIGTIINDSTLGDGVTTSPIAVLKNGHSNVDPDVMSKSRDSVEMSKAEFNDESFTSIVGGNRAVEGGSFLSGTINREVLGAMPSDESAIARYQLEVNEVLARKANAERASLSPFDISSPNTFLGNITYRMAESYIAHSAGSDSGIVSAVSSIADLTSSSTKTLLGSVTADGNEQNYSTISGDCTTVANASNTQGDLYCNSHNTISTKYIEYTKEDWLNALGGNVKDDGTPTESGELAEFITLGSRRKATVGVQSDVVCEAYHESSDGFLKKTWNLIKNALGVYQSCDGVPDEIAVGAKYTLSDNNSYKDKVELLSGYMLYDEVNALVSDAQSKVSIFKEEYYKKNPRDNSAAGKIAQMSGMTKEEAEIAIGYASYLAYLRNYDPSQRFAFNSINKDIEAPPLIIDDADIKETLYCYWRGKTEFSDLRNRNQVA